MTERTRVAQRDDLGWRQAAGWNRSVASWREDAARGECGEIRKLASDGRQVLLAFGKMGGIACEECARIGMEWGVEDVIDEAVLVSAITCEREGADPPRLDDLLRVPTRS